MKFKCEFDLDNPIFDGDRVDKAKAMLRSFSTVAEVYSRPIGIVQGKIIDNNRNIIGEWNVTED